MRNKKTSAFITQYWLAFAIALTVLLAWLFPKPALALPRFYVLDIGVVVIMFLGSLKLAPGRFKEAVSKPNLILVAVGSVFFLAPFLSILLASAVGFDSGQDKIAVLICSAQASTLATGIVLTEIAGGAVALAMVITVTNNILTVFLTPLAFRLFGDTSVAVDHMAMGTEIALKIVLPVLVAQLFRKWLAEWAFRRSRGISITSQLIILIYIYAGVAAGLERATGQISVLPKVFALVVSFHLGLMIINAIVSKLLTKNPGQRTAFVLCASQKTLPAAILIWKSYFPTLPLGPIVAVTYHLTQLVVDSVIAPVFMRLPIIRNYNTNIK
jgi:predicted Na+-dependent transporter